MMMSSCRPHNGTRRQRETGPWASRLGVLSRRGRVPSGPQLPKGKGEGAHLPGVAALRCAPNLACGTAVRADQLQRGGRTGSQRLVQVAEHASIAGCGESMYATARMAGGVQQR